MTTIPRCPICIRFGSTWITTSPLPKPPRHCFCIDPTLLDRLAHITAMLGSDLKDPDYCLTLGIILRAELEQRRTEQNTLEAGGILK